MNWLDHPDPLFTALVGPPGRDRLRTTPCLLALIGYLLFAIGQQIEVALGLVSAPAAHALSASFVGGGAVFYAVVRSGASRHWNDPSLTWPQSAFAVTMVAWAYAITGPTRGALLTLCPLILMFAMFQLRARQSATLAAYAMALLIGVMAWLAWRDAPDREPRIELVHGVFLAISLGCASVQAQRLARLRARAAQQRKDLNEALERISRLATRDELTGLPNRRAMLDTLRAEAARLRRYPQASGMALVMIDLDHFKQINDRHGHAAGDAVLQGFAERAQAELRGHDVMARWGGEEFLLLLPDTDLTQAQACVQRLRERLLLTPFDEAVPGLRLGFSAGLAHCTGTADIDAAIRRADLAMYRAKGSGRDRTETG